MCASSLRLPGPDGGRIKTMPKSQNGRPWQTMANHGKPPNWQVVAPHLFDLFKRPLIFSEQSCHRVASRNVRKVKWYLQMIPWCLLCASVRLGPFCHLLPVQIRTKPSVCKAAWTESVCTMAGLPLIELFKFDPFLGPPHQELLAQVQSEWWTKASRQEGQQIWWPLSMLPCRIASTVWIGSKRESKR